MGEGKRALSAHSLEASYSWGRPQTVGSESVMGAHLCVVC
jgi:hypothetical protein